MTSLPQTIYRYIYILTISALFAFSPSPVYAQADTTATDTTDVKVHKKDLAGHQLCVGVDIFNPIMNLFLKDTGGRRYGYEIEANYYLHNEYYLAAEGGWGSSDVNYTDLKYTTTNTFMRLGFNKSVLTRDKPVDWDMMFIGFRVGVANIIRSNVAFTVIDSLWGNSQGTLSQLPPFTAWWAEFNGGVRVELAKNLFAGWNARAKFLMNGKSESFKELTPLYIAGYGKGDKNSAFDLNVYISYAFRWDRKSLHGINDSTDSPIIKPAHAADGTKANKSFPGSNEAIPDTTANPIIKSVNATDSTMEVRDLPKGKK